MPHHIPVPATISISINNRVFGHFDIYPEAKHGPDGLEIVGWTAKDGNDYDRGLFDILAQTVIPRNVMREVCRLTFENENMPSLPVIFTIGDQHWEMHMRAVEKEYETVHYEIENDGEWMEMIETYVGDIVKEDYFVFAEREVAGSISFGNQDTMYSQMA